MFDLGIIKQFCDLINVVIRRTFQLLLSHIIAIMNDKLYSRPPSAHLPIHRRFRYAVNEIQAGISEMFRRLSALFELLCMIRVADCSRNEDGLLHCLLSLDNANNFLCNSGDWTEGSSDHWKTY